MRRLSCQQANSCETAVRPKCRCRCGGQFHGTMRGPVALQPPDDPHAPPMTCEAIVGSRKCRQPATWCEAAEMLLCARHNGLLSREAV